MRRSADDDCARKQAVILQNHGLLVATSSIEATVFFFISLEKCCQVQLLADAAAAGRGSSTSFLFFSFYLYLYLPIRPSSALHLRSSSLNPSAYDIAPPAATTQDSQLLQSSFNGLNGEAQWPSTPHQPDSADASESAMGNITVPSVLNLSKIHDDTTPRAVRFNREVAVRTFHRGTIRYVLMLSLWQQGIDGLMLTVV